MLTVANRVKLKVGEQKRLISLAVKGVGSLKKLAIQLKRPYSTMKGYSSGRVFLPEELFYKLLNFTLLKTEDFQFEVIPFNWGRILGGRKGIKTLMKKYPSKLLEWRKLANQHSAIVHRKKIRIPSLNEKFAEFIGVYLGDGTLTKYSVVISGDSRYDRSYFHYLSNLIRELFGLSAKIRVETNKNTLLLRVNSVSLSLLLNRYGLKCGDKLRNNSLIPREILAETNLAVACLRGLMDTDGCFARHGNKVCLRFGSANPNLLNQVSELGVKLNLFTFKTRDQAGVTCEEKVRAYFRLVGSSNLRNIVKFYIWNKKNLFVSPKDLPIFYKQSFFKTLNLPFKLKVLSASG